MPQPELNLASLRQIVELIAFDDWTFTVSTMGMEGFCLQVEFFAADAGGSNVARQTGRKWYISKFSCEGEVVQTALLAVIVAMEHEVRERFTYRGKRVFGPHVSIQAKLASADNLERRE